MKLKWLTNLMAASAVGLLAAINASAQSAPGIVVQPVSSLGLLQGQVQFNVTASGSSPSYQWYFSDLNSNLIAAVVNGPQASGSVVSGATSATLSLANLQFADPTNFIVIVSNATGTATSSLASLLSVTNHAVLAYWDFNGPEFTNTTINPAALSNPTPYLGTGTALAVGGPNAGTNGSPFSGSIDPFNGIGFATNNHLPNFSWGTSHYPASGGNKQNGVQFNVSTVGAMNITVSYDCRVSATASDYERLQYTTDGSTWLDYPSSSTFNGVALTTYAPFSYNLTGFPGVDNNPNFGIRVVTETQNTATYGNSASTSYLGAQNTYGTTGTVTYDVVSINGDAITNSAAPPVISSIPNTNTLDFVPLTLNFTVSDSSTSPDLLTYSATPLNPSLVNGSFSFGGSGTNRTLLISPFTTPNQSGSGPILVMVTDPNTGHSAATSFILTLNSVNLAPTNSLTSLPLTNMLANSSLTIPFKVSDDRSPAASLTYSVSSLNNTLIPSNNIVVNGQGTTNLSVTITPAVNQLGIGQISVTAYDNDTQEARSTTATIALTVRPNTNVLALDYFNYDNTGSLDAVGTNFWGHLSGNFGQLQVASGDPSELGNGYAVLDGPNNTENLQARLIGAPYSTNSSAVLYMSFLANMDPTALPTLNGSYFILFDDGFGSTANVAGRVVAATNGAANGFYRLGVANNAPGNATNSQIFPLDLAPGSNYVVVSSLVVATGQTKLWINPASVSSPSVTDTSSVGTNLFNVSDIFLRESGGFSAGRMRIAKLKVGTTFDSVLPSLRINAVGTNAVLTSSDPTLGIQSSTNATGPYVDVSASTPFTNSLTTNRATYYRFGK